MGCVHQDGVLVLFAKKNELYLSGSSQFRCKQFIFFSFFKVLKSSNLILKKNVFSIKFFFNLSLEFLLRHHAKNLIFTPIETF
jgi:competence CoiA-like predicted nuclease